MSVYKQLYRAAKAKQKLKLRVTTSTREAEAEPKMTPKPVTIEDVPETSEPAEAKPVEKTQKPVIVPSTTAIRVQAVERPRPTPPAPEWHFTPESQLHAQLSNMARNHEELEKNIAQIEAEVAQMSLRASALPRVPPISPLRADRVRDKMPSPPQTERFSAAWNSGSLPAPFMVAAPAVALATPEVVKVTITPQKPSEEKAAAAEVPAPAPRATFAVCCNSCDRNIPDSHYHCSTCDDGDFDLCQGCVDMGITCYGADHWLIKRFTKNGAIINSTTERIAPKPKAAAKPEPVPAAAPAPAPAPAPRPAIPTSFFDFHESAFRDATGNVRTCNNCVAGKSRRRYGPPRRVLVANGRRPDMTEAEFVHCTSCFDFDLCKACFIKNDHGHHPKHGFIPAVEGTVMGEKVSRLLAPGRSQRHNAVCDGCEKFIVGIRHKCLDCPDWDYCSECVVNAGFVHPNHRFVPVYEPISEIKAHVRAASRQVHYGICCDGPLCMTSRSGTSYYIVGERYKCAVCDNTDFCANCEASPSNTHNKTHPLIKFKTPVRHVSVTTTGEHEDGKRMPTMGDRVRHSFASSQSRATETTLTSRDISINSVQTVVDVKPTEAEAVKADEEHVKEEFKEEAKEEEEEKEIKQEKIESEVAPPPRAAPSVEDLVAVYERDTVADGTVLPPSHVFEQTWVLRNAGTVAWPAGCRVKFVSGDYMGHVDPNHPAGIQELVSASETTICYNSLAPGDEFAFTVLLRTPARFGKAISYWRLTTEDGVKFGHRLWCDIEVQPTKSEEAKAPEPVVEDAFQSPLVIPKLEKESPVSSVHQDAEPESASLPAEEEGDDFDDLEDDEWADDQSQDGFLTDDEYDILDASDEEYLEDQQKKLHKK